MLRKVLILSCLMLTQQYQNDGKTKFLHFAAFLLARSTENWMEMKQFNQDFQYFSEKRTDK